MKLNLERGVAAGACHSFAWDATGGIAGVCSKKSKFCTNCCNELFSSEIRTCGHFELFYVVARTPVAVVPRGNDATSVQLSTRTLTSLR